MKNLKFLLLVVFLLSLQSVLFGQSLNIVTWNLESGKSKDTAVAKRIKEFQGVDIWGLTEVRNATALSFARNAAQHGENARYASILGTTGGADKLAVVYNSDLLRRVQWRELSNLRFRNYRSPLWVEFEIKKTKQRFILVVNHLARGRANIRHQQAKGLNEWVRKQTLPVIAVGDFNYDWRVNGGDRNHDKGYDNMIEGGEWTWVRPVNLFKTQCSRRFNSVLDFVFVNKIAKTWKATSKILRKRNDCPRDYASDLVNPDHRPVQATFDLGDGAENFRNEKSGTISNREEILKRIELLERQLRELKEAVKKLPQN